MFLGNCWNWVCENAAQIAVVIGAVCTSGVGINVFNMFRGKKTTKENTAATTKLTEVMAENKKLQEEVHVSNTKITALEEQNNNLVDACDKLLVKVNAMLEVQSLVYQTIKDDDTRTAINNIITNAKYNETASRAKLLAQIEELKENTKVLAQNAISKAETTVKKAKSILAADSKTVTARV